MKAQRCIGRFPANGLPKLTTCLCSKTIFTAFALAGSQQARFSVEVCQQLLIFSQQSLI
jgi:hypothetical protein